MRNLKIEGEIQGISFTSRNGIDVDIDLNSDCTVSVTHKTDLTGGTQANFSERELKEYIDFLQTFYNQLRANESPSEASQPTYTIVMNTEKFDIEKLAREIEFYRKHQM